LANEPLGLPLDEMRALGFVQWDRFVEEPNAVTVYGWIRRGDARADFVVLTSVPDGIGYLTSSAAYSEAIGHLLRGSGGGETHALCQRVEDHAGLTNVIRLGLAGGCRAGRDGDCTWAGCPQALDGEPMRSGRHCPLDKGAGDE
jgi:hypothetical protein